MEKLRNFFSRIEVTFRRSNNVTKIMVIAAIVLSMITLIGLRLSIDSLKRDTEDLRQTAAAMEEANQDLQELIDNADSIQGVLDYAEQNLGLVDPDTVIIDPES